MGAAGCWALLSRRWTDGQRHPGCLVTTHTTTELGDTPRQCSQLCPTVEVWLSLESLGMDMGLTAKASLPGAVRGLRGTGMGLGVGWTPDSAQRPSTPKAEDWGSQSSRVEERMGEGHEALRRGIPTPQEGAFWPLSL